MSQLEIRSRQARTHQILMTIHLQMDQKLQNKYAVHGVCNPWSMQSMEYAVHGVCNPWSYN